MKKLLSNVTVAAVLAFSANAMAGDFKEGVNYQVLSPDVQFKADKQVVKIYSVNCPFCYRYDKSVIPSMVKNLPSGVTFDDYHIQTKPPLGKEKTEVLAFAKTQSEKAFHDAKMAYYKHYHDDKIHFENGEEAIAFGLKAAGLDRAAFDKGVNSAEAQALIKKWDQGLEVAKIQGIPAIVVNGKYLITTKSITSMGMLDDLIAELSAK